MLGHLKARWLLAPLLAATLSTGQEVKGPHALINLDINSTSDEINHHDTILRLDILESKSPCGYGNVTLNGQLLAQDGNGAGSGPVISDNGITIFANWSFSCVHLDDEFQGQLMTFDAISVDEEEVHDVRFSVQFQQMAPPSISFINGTVSITEAHIPTPVTEEKLTKETSTLDDELADLKSMMRQLVALEEAIASKVQYISDTYDVNSHEELHSVWRCDSLKCVVKTMYRRAKHMASRLYGHGIEGNGHFGGRPHSPGWRFHHGHRPDWFPHDGAHGNHSHPHPRPHPHPPHHEPPHFHLPPSFCHCAPPPPPPPHESYDEQPPRFHPPPSHQILEDGMDQENLALVAGSIDDIVSSVGRS
ncbi:uncharacterized protein F4812DRAFT_297943 [Daldinia caldariorum]|uniref:uncharacterized protein n=1 Tax=Daldinia caldariorum TaxID=326644 RepID=UPI00200796F6|nr:uncharacterized protein F4812DRAFT_297943 [Daldinia caldariorum]KAI1469663.1 hypothetical protein F4812DRAFT_297943 [Daldinia caldariorum]